MFDNKKMHMSYVCQFLTKCVSLLYQSKAKCKSVMFIAVLKCMPPIGSKA